MNTTGKGERENWN